MNLFFDTSALAKNFLNEKGSIQVRELIDDPANTIWISELAKIEFSCALFRRFRNHELTENLVSEALEGFEFAINHFEIQPIGSRILNGAQDFVISFAHLHPIRTLDAIHLSTFIEIKNEEGWHFVTADLPLGRFAKQLGYSVIDSFTDL